MQCEAFDQRLHDILDRRASPETDPQLREHVECCERCRMILRVHGQLNGVVQSLQISAVEPVSVGNRLRLVAIMPALGACLLLGVAGWLLRYTPNEMARPRSAVQSTSTDQGVRAQRGQARPTDLSSRPRQTSTLVLHQPLFGLQLLSQADWSDSFSSVSTAIEVPRLETNWMTVVAHEMAPVHQSVASALNLLRRTLASAPSHEKSIDG